MTEKLEGHEIYPVKTFGVMEVYHRRHYRVWHLPKYIVFHRNGRALEDFRTRRAANIVSDASGWCVFSIDFKPCKKED